MRLRLLISIAILLLGLLPAPIPPGIGPAAAVESSTAGPLQVCGRALCGQDGTRFRWRGITAFALAGLVADGRHQEAEAFVRWAAERGFTVLRVLAMNHGWMELTPEAGRVALPATFALARRHGLIVQVVALAGTGQDAFDSEMFLRRQVHQVATLCAVAGNCVLEIANEPYHPTQASLDDPGLMRRLQREVPQGLPVAWGAAVEDDSDRMAGGSYVVVHLARGGDRWERVGRLRLLEALSRRVGKFVVDNEPIGAAEQAEPGRRDAQPAAFFAQGLLARIFDVGSTFHCEDCLHARVPGPVQARAAEAFVAGATLVPTDVTLAYHQPGSPDGPVVASPGSESGAALVVAGVSGDRGWAARLGGASSDTPVRWNRGWRAVREPSPWPEVEVWRVER